MFYVKVVHLAPEPHDAGSIGRPKLVEVGFQISECTTFEIAKAQDPMPDARLLRLRLVERDEHGNRAQTIPLDIRRHAVFVMNADGKTIDRYQWACAG